MKGTISTLADFLWLAKSLSHHNEYLFHPFGWASPDEDAKCLSKSTINQSVDITCVNPLINKIHWQFSQKWLWPRTAVGTPKSIIFCHWEACKTLQDLLVLLPVVLQPTVSSWLFFSDSCSKFRAVYLMFPSDVKHLWQCFDLNYMKTSVHFE